VVIAVIERRDEVLIGRRGRGEHLSGFWEFPGGKLKPGESHEDAIRRECREELGVEVEPGTRIECTDFDYEDRKLTLHSYRCRLLSGDPTAAADREARWVARSDLAGHSFPPANATVLSRLTSSGHEDCG